MPTNNSELRVFRNGKLIDLISNPDFLDVVKIGSHWIHEENDHEEKLYITEVSIRKGSAVKPLRVNCYTVPIGA
jgi:hypothetical protein